MAFSFGATNTTSNTTPSFAFGSSTTPSTGGLSFGSPATGTTGLNFNAPTATPQPSTGLSFGTPVTTASSFSFGGSTGGSLSFGTPTTSANTGLNFKLSTTGGLGFGTTPQTSLSLGTPGTGLTFGSTVQPTSTSAPAPLSFGLAPAAQATPASTAAGGLSFGSTPSFSAPKPTLSFGTPATTSAATASTGLFSFSTTKTTAATGFTSTTSAGTGLFGTPTTQTTTITPASAPFKGLGGVDPTQSLSGSGNQTDNKCGKGKDVPNEVMQTIEAFKHFVKQQKNLACEVSRASVKPMKKVMEDTDSLKQLLSSISSVQQKNRTLANKLKIDTSKCLAQCEMAQRTHDTPIGLQNDNVAPLEFFIDLVAKFERDTQELRQEIDNAEKHVKSLSQPAALSPQELSIALKRLHDSFVALAGRLQNAHSQVIAQKERHLSMRRHFLKDSSNIFEPSEKREIIPRRTVNQTIVSPGPTPFSSIGNTHSVSLLSYQDTNISPFQTGTQLSGWGSSAAPNMISGTQTSFLQSPNNTLSSPQATDNQNFQLLKPPLGNKRGKR